MSEVPPFLTTRRARQSRAITPDELSRFKTSSRRVRLEKKSKDKFYLSESEFGFEEFTFEEDDSELS